MALRPRSGKNEPMSKTDVRETIRDLTMVARGRSKADMIIRDATLLNVFTGELIEKTSIAVKKGRVALVGQADRLLSNSTRIIDAKGRIATPGLLDGHVHIESSMLTVKEFSRAVIPHGTTSVVMDPHEIANVLGIEGVKLMHDEGLLTPLKVYVSVPSCVPASSPLLETAGATIGPREIAWAFSNLRNAIALGEVMNYSGVIGCHEKILEEIAIALRSGRTAEGHFCGRIPEELNAYVASGISSCHESTTKQASLAKLRLGMYVMLREGSAWRDLKEVIKCVTETAIDSRRVCLASDDRQAQDILREGHMDQIVRRAIEEGVDPIRTIQMSTINTAEHFGIEKDVGSIAPGRCADIVLFDDLNKAKVNEVIADGRLVARRSRMVVGLRKMTYPDWSTNTVRLNRPPRLDDLRIMFQKESARIRVIEIVEGSVMTKNVIEEVKVIDKQIKANPDVDLSKVAVMERHRATGNIGVGFVKGFGFKEGAVASTVAHDSHNLLIVGTNDEDMVSAASKLSSAEGGMIAVDHQKALAMIPLPIAGLMSTATAERVGDSVAKLTSAWKHLGCDLHNAFMTMSLLSLSVIPELRITDKGLVDTVAFKKVGLIV